MEPSVSVLLPVYNGVEYLTEAIESILGQTFSDFELIIIDDGSTDNPSAIIERYRDRRIRLYVQENEGLARTLNRGIALARGMYIARQDQDDISLSTRLEKQVDFLQANPEVGMVGTWANIWIGSKPGKRAHRHPEDNQLLQFELLFDNPFVHSSMMLRRSVFDCVGLYTTDKERQPPEDYELWSRVARKFNVANLHEVLVVYREVSSSMSRMGPNPFLNNLIAISAENFAWRLGESVPTQDIQDVAALFHNAFDRLSPGARVENMALIIERAAAAIGHDVPHPLLQRRLASRMYGLNLRFFLYRYDGPFVRWAIEFLRRMKRNLLG
jgi:glycosyltransferase involved in cell wall biosynthesis